MDAQRFSVLKEWSAWTYRLRALVQYVALVLTDTREMQQSAMVSQQLQAKLQKLACNTIMIIVGTLVRFFSLATNFGDFQRCMCAYDAKNSYGMHQINFKFHHS